MKAIGLVLFATFVLCASTSSSSSEEHDDSASRWYDYFPTGNQKKTAVSLGSTVRGQPQSRSSSADDPKPTVRGLGAVEIGGRLNQARSPSSFGTGTITGAASNIGGRLNKANAMMSVLGGFGPSSTRSGQGTKISAQFSQLSAAKSTFGTKCGKGTPTTQVRTPLVVTSLVVPSGKGKG
jgi:hypothetical protein